MVHVSKPVPRTIGFTGHIHCLVIPFMSDNP